MTFRDTIHGILKDLRPHGIRICFVDGDVRITRGSQSVVHFWIDGEDNDDDNNDVYGDDEEEKMDDHDGANNEKKDDDDESNVLQNLSSTRKKRSLSCAKEVPPGVSVFLTSLRTSGDDTGRKNRKRKRHERIVIVIGQKPERNMTRKNAFAHFVTVSLNIDCLEKVE